MEKDPNRLRARTIEKSSHCSQLSIRATGYVPQDSSRSTETVDFAGVPSPFNVFFLYVMWFVISVITSFIRGIEARQTCN